MTVKEELSDEQWLPINKQEPPVDQEISFCKKCFSRIAEHENGLCDDCYQNEITSEAYPCILNKLSTCVKYSGLKTPQAFVELLKYIEDDLPEIDGCHKSNQLLSVLIKLHSNKHLSYINKYRFPLVYVQTVEALSRKLKFLGEDAWKNDPMPVVLQQFLGETDKKMALLHVITLKIDLCDNASRNNYYKVLVAYTLSGKVFFVSSHYTRYATFKAMVLNSSVLNALNSKNVYVIYKLDNKFERCSPEEFGKKSETLDGEIVRGYLNGVSNTLGDNFAILRDIFPSFMVLEEDGSTFLKKIFLACCGLLNYNLCLDQ